MLISNRCLSLRKTTLSISFFFIWSFAFSQKIVCGPILGECSDSSAVFWLMTKKTDSIVVVISEQTGKIVYFKGGEFIKIKSKEMLNELVIQDLNK